MFRDIISYNEGRRQGDDKPATVAFRQTYFRERDALMIHLVTPLTSQSVPRSLPSHFSTCSDHFGIMAKQVLFLYYVPGTIK